VPLDIELTEMQKIIQGQMAALGSLVLTDGFVGMTALTYTGGALGVPADVAVIGGVPIPYTQNMSISGVAGATVYLAYSEVTVAYADTIKTDGNQSGGTNVADNGILDSDMGYETSRRVQRQIQLVTSTADATKKYIPVATVSAGGTVTDNRVKVALPTQLGANNAQFLQGYAPSTSTAPNAVVVRDTNGDIFNTVPSIAPALSGWTTTGTSWKRIAESAAASSTKKEAMFLVDWTTSGGAVGHALINVAITDIYGPIITQYHYSSSSAAQGVVRARVVYHPTASGSAAYVELFKATQALGTFNVKMIGSEGWTMMAGAPTGSIPTDYTSLELTFGAGVATTGQLISTNATLAPLKVASTIMVDNLNAKFVAGATADAAATASTIPVRGTTGKITEIAANRRAVSEFSLTGTAATAATYTVPVAGIYTVKLYLRISAVSTANVSISVNYTGLGGAKSVIVVPAGTLLPTEEYYFVPVMFIASAGTNIYVTASSAGSAGAYLTTIITEEG
jgi:hypothetical protein